MKFRGRICDCMGIQHLTNIVATIAKAGKRGVLRLTLDKIYFTLTGPVTGSAVLWSEITQSNFFNEYNMEGVSEENNEIYLDLELASLLRVLRSARNAKSLKLKLTKKHSPCLTCEIEQPSLLAQCRQVVHDIPVTVVPRRHWDDYQEPPTTDFDVSVVMPPLKTVKNVVERMRTIGLSMIWSASKTGALTLRAENDTVQVATHFKDLVSPTPGRANMSSVQRQQDGDDAQTFETRVDIRPLHNFLSGQQSMATKVVCSIEHRMMLHFLMIHDDVTLQYIIPGMSL